MAKITNNFYPDGIYNTNIDGESYNIPHGETVETSKNFAEGIKKIYSRLEVKDEVEEVVEKVEEEMLEIEEDNELPVVEETGAEE